MGKISKVGRKNCEYTPDPEYIKIFKEGLEIEIAIEMTYELKKTIKDVEVQAIESMLQELIEKDIPKKPYYEGDSVDKKGNIIMDTWYCPNCNKAYELDYEEYNHCQECGQKILWED